MLKFSAIVLLVFHVLLVSSQGTAGNTSGGNTFKVTFYPGKINCTGAGVVEQTLSFPSSYPACIPYPSSATLRTVSPFPAAHIRVKSCSGSRVKADWMCDEGCSSCILAASLKSDMCHIESDLSSMWFNDVSCGSGGDGDSTIVIVLGVSGGIIGVSVAVCFAVWMRRRDKQTPAQDISAEALEKGIVNKPSQVAQSPEEEHEEELEEVAPSPKVKSQVTQDPGSMNIKQAAMANDDPKKCNPEAILREPLEEMENPARSMPNNMSKRQVDPASILPEPIVVEDVEQAAGTEQQAKLAASHATKQAQKQMNQTEKEPPKRQAQPQQQSIPLPPLSLASATEQKQQVQPQVRVRVKYARPPEPQVAANVREQPEVAASSQSVRVQPHVAVSSHSVAAVKKAAVKVQPVKAQPQVRVAARRAASGDGGVLATACLAAQSAASGTAGSHPAD